MIRQLSILLLLALCSCSDRHSPGHYPEHKDGDKWAAASRLRPAAVVAPTFRTQIVWLYFPPGMDLHRANWWLESSSDYANWFYYGPLSSEVYATNPLQLFRIAGTAWPGS